MAILTVSRELGSGGKEIARAVASDLNYAYVDKQSIFKDIKAAGGEWEKWGEALDEHCPTVWEKYDWSFRGFSALVQSCILNHALSGNVVIIGRGGNFLLNGIASAFRVRIVAPLDSRIESIMKRESMERGPAKWLIEKTDSERACFMRTIYGKEWNDPAEYDMVFDTHSEKNDVIIALIETALSQRKPSASLAETLRMRAEAAKIKAMLLTNPDLFIPTLDVYYDGSRIVMRGVVHSSKEHRSIEETAKKLAGDLPIKCEVHYRR